MAKKDQPKGKSESKGITAEATKPLRVEISFPAITDLKQAIGTDSDGNLIIQIQFKAKVDQFEVFRLVNLLKQPHGALYAIIGSPQSALDFKFDAKQIHFEILQSQTEVQLDPSTSKDSNKSREEPEEKLPRVTKIYTATFKHFEKEEKPFGVAIDYVTDSTGEIHSIASRGLNATEAVMDSVVSILPGNIKEPFEAIAALEKLESSPEGNNLIRVLQVGSFNDGARGEKGKKNTSKGE
jgi:hypothetical protein